MKLAYTVPEFCEATGLGRTSAYKLAANHQIEMVRVAGRTLIPASSAQALIERALEDATRREQR